MIFGKHKEELVRLRERVANLEESLTQKTAEINNLIGVRKDFEMLKGRYVSLESKLREQNDADLLFVSMKIVKEIKRGTPRSELKELLREQELARRQRSALTSLALQQTGISRGVGLGLLGSAFG